MIRQFTLYCLCLVPVFLTGQSFTTYQTGNTADVVTNPSGGICLMGGATENDNAMKWFLTRANGGDVLVLRTSGSDGYNNYLYTELGIPVNSVETIVCNSAQASNSSYIHQKIKQAEAIWFAGGNQWTYISYWRNTPVDSLINEAIMQRNVVVGGTSAGMAIQGKFYFSAQNGTIVSSVALNNPFHTHVTVDSGAFIQNALLSSVITDTHFDNPDRKGRLSAFLSRIFTDYSVQGKAIACDEYTAVCISPDGNARVFGGFPSFDDNAYFIQTNCDLPEPGPENCTPGNPLTWNRNHEALKVYRIKGTNSGVHTFNLNDWKTGSGGTWLHWSINGGIFSEQNGTPVICDASSVDFPRADNFVKIFPNPASGLLHIQVDGLNTADFTFQVSNATGQNQPLFFHHTSPSEVLLDISTYQKGLYFIQISSPQHQVVTRTFMRE